MMVRFLQAGDSRPTAAVNMVRQALPVGCEEGAASYGERRYGRNGYGRFVDFEAAAGCQALRTLRAGCSRQGDCCRAASNSEYLLINQCVSSTASLRRTWPIGLQLNLCPPQEEEFAMNRHLRNWVVLGAMAGGLWMPGAGVAQEPRETAATEPQVAANAHRGTCGRR